MRRFGAVLSALVVLLGVVTITPAQAAGAYPTGTVTFTGHGNGHGRGMGQYGAYGYAKNNGWNATQILNHYYGGSTLSNVGNPPMTVRLTARDGQSLGPVTSSRAFTAGGFTVSAGATATITATPAGPVLSTATACGTKPVWTTPVASATMLSAVFSSGADRAPLLSFCGGPSYRGNLTLVPADGSLRTVNTVAQEDYVRDVVPRESPSGWGDTGGQAALEAQAVAARSYGMAQNRYPYAKTCDTQSCQVYGGAGGESPQANRAVASTAGQVLVDNAGRVRSTEFSSSTGGWTAGGTFPAVVDAGDAISPYHDWTVSIPVSTIERAYDVGALTAVRVTGRNGLGADGGRVLTVQVIGSQRTVNTTGDGMRIALGLRSNWFTPATAASESSPLRFFLSLAPGQDSYRAAFYGAPGDVALGCDWDGNGTDTLGVFRGGTWYLSNTNDTAATTAATFAFGQPGDQPVCGDWNGNGTDTIGVYRRGVLYERDSNSAGPSTRVIAFGNPGDTALVGDWDGNGTDTLGLFRLGQWFLTNRATGGTATANGHFFFGNPTDRPVVGSWNGDRFTTTGVVRDAVWYLTDSNLDPRANRQFWYGHVGDQVFSGRWKGGSVDGPGVARP
ncbi:MAG: SpoIID/LytB domain-containing protein [Mycobacteriaceae bacterium]